MQEAIESSDDLPPEAHAILRSLWQHLSSCEAQLAKFDKEIQKRACEDLEARRLTSVPGIDPVAAAAIAALAPDPCHLQEGIVTCSMGWLATTRTIHRRKATVRANIQDGRTDIETSSNHGSQCGRIRGQVRQDPAERLVGQHTPQKANDACNRGAVKQDGARRPGNTEHGGSYMQPAS